MEKTKSLIVMMLMSIVAFSVTSCLDSEDDVEDYTITPAEYSTYLNSMAGTYSGKMYFLNDTLSTENKTDSIYINNVIVRGQGDSTITAYLPMKYFVKGIKNHDEIKEIIEEEDETINLQMKFYIYQKYDNLISLGIYPYSVEYPFTYNGESHKLVLNFYRYLNVNGRYYNNSMLLDFYLYSIYLDSDPIVNYNVSEYGADSESIYRLYIEK